MMLSFTWVQEQNPTKLFTAMLIMTRCFSSTRVKAKWKQEELKERLAAIKLHGIDSLGIVNRLTEIISNQQNVNMKFISFETNDGLFEGRIKVLVYDTEHLEQLMRKFDYSKCPFDI